MPTLHSGDIAKYTIPTKQIYTDNRIATIIKHHSGEDFSDILAKDDNWDTFLHLSEMAGGILNWYDFGQTSSVLEIEAGFGALTGVLCDKCTNVIVTESSDLRARSIYERYKDRDNLSIYIGHITDMAFEAKFDYIILNGIFEKNFSIADLVNTSLTARSEIDKKQPYTDYLKYISTFLKPNGKILLSVTNRFGLHYFCGATDKLNPLPFDTIRNTSPSGNLFSKKELEDILENANLGCYKFYYPKPDYKLPQIVYTDAHLPEKNIQERLIPYYEKDCSLLAMEIDLYSDIIENGVFPFFANSYLIECAKSDREIENCNSMRNIQKPMFSDVVYAALSTDRGRENAFATTIHESGMVKKTALFREGRRNLQHLYDHIKDLQDHAIPTVDHQLVYEKEFINSLLSTNNNNANSSNIKCLEMPFIHSPTLAIYLREIVRKDKNTYITVFDRLWETILSSSETAADMDNFMLTPDNKISSKDWGVVLKRAYIELIPLNCFYQDGKFLFFDQEFMLENCPARYIMFRAVHYMYVFDHMAQVYVPQQLLKDRFGLTNIWSACLEMEEDFIRNIRRHKTYQAFYNKAWGNRENNRKNAELLLHNADHVLGYKTSPRLKKIQEVELDLLSELQKVCDKYGLCYYLIYGSLLGCIRHDEFIHWDDDADIAMPRADYNKLCEIADQEFKQPYFLQTPENDRECFYGGYAKLRNSNTTGIELQNWKHRCNHGIWIDIFPLDNCFHSTKLTQKKMRKITNIQMLLTAKIYKNSAEFYRIYGQRQTVKRIFFRSLSFLFNQEELYTKLNKLLVDGDEDSKYIGIFTHRSVKGKSRVFYRKDFNQMVYRQFDYLYLPVPIGYDRILQKIYGDNYNSYPAINERIPHHKAFFAPNVPYEKYMLRFTGAFSHIQDKTLILFGAGKMFEDYMGKHGEQYPPHFIVDNDKEKWNTTLTWKGKKIPIYSPQEMLDTPAKRRLVLICNIYYRQIETQIRKMGITDYYIYVQEKEWLTGDPP